MYVYTAWIAEVWCPCLQEWRKLGFTSLEDFMVDFWEGLFASPKDPNDLLAMIWTWQVSAWHLN